MCIGTLERRAPDSPRVEDAARSMSSPSAHAQKRARRSNEMHISDMVVRAIFVKRVDSLDLRIWAQAARALRETV